MKQIKFRLQALWFILTSKNFILLHSIQVIKHDNEEVGQKVGIIRRTDFSSKRDLYTMSASINLTFPTVGVTIPDDVDRMFFSDGEYKHG